MAGYRNKQDGMVYSAFQFDPVNKPDARVKPWPNEAGFQSRDMSWGYIEIGQKRVHVCVGNWIARDEKGNTHVYSDATFRATFEMPSETIISEDRIRQIAREEIDAWWKQQMVWLRANGSMRDYEVK